MSIRVELPPKTEYTHEIVHCDRGPELLATVLEINRAGLHDGVPHSEGTVDHWASSRGTHLLREGLKWPGHTGLFRGLMDTVFKAAIGTEWLNGRAGRVRRRAPRRSRLRASLYDIRSAGDVVETAGVSRCQRNKAFVGISIRLLARRRRRRLCEESMR